MNAHHDPATDSPLPGAPAPGTAGGQDPRGDVDASADVLQDAVLELAWAMLDMARHGDAARLLPLIDQGAPVDMRASDGSSLLMLAAYHGHARLVEELAARGADVDMLNDRGQTPLAGAVFKGFDDVVRVLVDAGADPDLGTPSARDSAVFFKRQALAALLPEPEDLLG